MIDVRAFRRDSRAVVRELGFLRDSWAPVDLPMAQVHLLLELSESGAMRPSELAERLMSDPASISRAVRALSDRGWLSSTDAPNDGRQRVLALTDPGREAVERIHRAADDQVRKAFAQMSAEDRDQVTGGFRAYARALERVRRQEEYTVREIGPADDPFVQAVIRQVMPEFGADGPGFAIHDPEVARMSAAYPGGRARYLVVEHRGRVVGGGGFAPLAGGDPDVCELRKMYFLPEARGAGLGANLLHLLLQEATEAGFTACYLETLTAMTRARQLYESVGFRRLEGPLGATGHFGCNQWYLRPLGVGSQPAPLADGS